MRLKDLDSVNQVEVRNVLVVNMTGIGNTILLTPFLRAIRERFINAKIHILLSDNGSVEVFANINLADHVVVLNKNQSLKNFLLLFFYFRDKYDLVFFRTQPKKNTGIFSLLKRIPVRVGHFIYANTGIPEKRVINVWPDMHSSVMHEIDINNQMALAVGVPPERLYDEVLIPITESDRFSATSKLDELGLKEGSYVCIHPLSGALQSWKRWPLDHWIELVRMIQEARMKVVVLGSKSEYFELERAFDKVSDKLLILAGLTSLMETAAVIEKSIALICNDSCMMIMASAINHLQIVIMGPSNLNKVRPRGNNAMIIKGDCECYPGGHLKPFLNQIIKCEHRKCLADTSPKEIMQTLVRLIESKSIQETFVEERSEPAAHQA